MAVIVRAPADSAPTSVRCWNCRRKGLSKPRSRTLSPGREDGVYACSECGALTSIRSTRGDLIWASDDGMWAISTDVDWSRLLARRPGARFALEIQSADGRRIPAFSEGSGILTLSPIPSDAPSELLQAVTFYMRSQQRSSPPEGKSVRGILRRHRVDNVR